ncbi:MAG: zinc ABC transporter substrate-binding protein [Verrucomicrobiota bacterium]
MKLALTLLAVAGLASHAFAEELKIVAAENFYGSVAEQIAGSSATVTSILSNPNQDPHEFQTNAETAKAVADADIIIYSGIGYDDWMDKLLGVQGKDSRTVIRVSDLIGAKDGDNPHIWYNPKTMPALATKLGDVLKNPATATQFINSLKPLTEKIAELKKKTAGIKVTATEPVFGYMAAALGFEMLNYDYQLAVMNDTEPSFKQVADFEDSLKSKTAKILFYNRQVTDPSTSKMESLAKDNDVPIVGVTETQPLDQKTYLEWMLSELSGVEKALP